MSGASTMRNAIKRITHKERSQPASRKKFGFLEKHKDYVERAKHHHKRRDYIKVLKQKAAERNPDEFYFKMNSSKVVDGVHKDLENGCLDDETVKLMKTQDLGYLIHKTSIDLRKAERLKENLHLIGDKSRRQHTTFVDTKDELEEFDVAKHFDTAPEFVNRSFNRPRTKTLVSGGILNQSSRRDVKQVAKLSEQSYSELNKRVTRVKKLKKAVRALELQRNLMGPGSKRKVVEGGDGKPPVFKWKRQRQR